MFIFSISPLPAMHMRRHTHTLFSHLYVGPENGTQIVRLGSKAFTCSAISLTQITTLSPLSP